MHQERIPAQDQQQQAKVQGPNVAQAGGTGPMAHYQAIADRSPVVAQLRAMHQLANAPVQRVGSSAAKGLDAEGHTEEELPGDAPMDEEAEEMAGLEDEWDAGLQSEEPEELMESPESQPLQAKMADPAGVVQMVIGRNWRSGRIAARDQDRARRARGLRGARNREVIRFAPQRVRTYLQFDAAIGHNVLICPRGSYLQRVNNFAYRGSRAADFAALGPAPAGQVWHHHHDFVPAGVNAGHGSMIRLRVADHLPGHYGGVSQWNAQPGNAVYG